MPADILTHEKRMSMTLADFYRTLPAALKRTGMQRDEAASPKQPGKEHVIVISRREKKIEIILTQGEGVRLGALTFPQVEARFIFHGYDGNEMSAFLNRFDLAFQRGGG